MDFISNKFTGYYTGLRRGKKKERNAYEEQQPDQHSKGHKSANSNRHTPNTSTIRVKAFVYQLGNMTKNVVVRFR